MSGDLVISTLKNDVSRLEKFVNEMARNVLVRVRDDSWSSEEQIQVCIIVIVTIILTIYTNDAYLFYDIYRC
jgi:uncharacterized protein YecE (DUF72 family)